MEERYKNKLKNDIIYQVNKSYESQIRDRIKDRVRNFFFSYHDIVFSFLSSQLTGIVSESNSYCK